VKAVRILPCDLSACRKLDYPVIPTAAEGFDQVDGGGEALGLKARGGEAVSAGLEDF
jgi:hypothetical protein